MIRLFVKIVMLFLINHLKLLLIVVKKDSLIENQISHIVKIVKNLFMYECFLKTNQHTVNSSCFSANNTP